ncbi:MAG: hypothetical protein WBJ13_12720 [Sedimentibacter sp.]
MNGELDVEMDIKSNDEIGAKSINSLTKRLKTYIVYINESALNAAIEAAKQTTSFIENSIIAINKGASLADKTGM